MSNGDRSLSLHTNPTFSSGRGLEVGRLQFRTRRSGEVTGPVYIEKHQGRHTLGKTAWGCRDRTGSRFLLSVASRSELDLFRVIVCRLGMAEGARHRDRRRRPFRFSDMTKVASDSGTKAVHVQASFEKAGGFFQFHCHPDTSSGTARSRIAVGRQDYGQAMQDIRLVWPHRRAVTELRSITPVADPPGSATGR